MQSNIAAVEQRFAGRDLCKLDKEQWRAFQDMLDRPVTNNTNRIGLRPILCGFRSCAARA